MAKEINLPNHIELLSKASIQILALLEDAVSDCSIPLCNMRCCDDEHLPLLLQQLMHQTVLGFRTCFNCLTNLCQTILGRKKRYEVLHRLVMFFSRSLDHLHTLCSTQGKTELGESQRPDFKRARMDDEYIINKHMSGMLVSIVQMEWEPGQTGHSEILEGMLFSILEHVGRLLSNAIFKEHVATSDRIGNITKGLSSRSPKSAKLEARYMVPILHAALGRSSARKETIARVLAENPSYGNGQRRSLSSGYTPNLLIKARKMIQSSLVKSAVGGEGLDCLKLPSPPDEGEEYAPDIEPGVEVYGPEWLQESVWALVGWELAVQ